MEGQRRDRRRRVSVTPSGPAKQVAPSDTSFGERRSKLKDLCKEDKLKVVDLISQLQHEKERSRSALAMRKGDQDKYMEEYRKLKKKYASLKDDYEELRRKYDQSLDLLREARSAAHTSSLVSEEIRSPDYRKPTLRPATTSKRGAQTASCDTTKQTYERKASEEVRDLRSMISCLSKSVRKLNESAIKTQEPLVSLRLPVSSPPADLNDTAQSGKSVHLQPLNLNVLFEDPDQEDRVSKVLARARRTRAPPKAADSSQYRDDFYTLIQELEQAVAL